MLLWRMRIKHLQTLEAYLQEVVASTVVSALPADARQCVARAVSLALAPFLLKYNASASPSAFPQPSASVTTLRQPTP